MIGDVFVLSILPGLNGLSRRLLFRDAFKAYHAMPSDDLGPTRWWRRVQRVKCPVSKVELLLIARLGAVLAMV